MSKINKIILLILSTIGIIGLLFPYPVLRMLGVLLSFYVIPIVLILSLKPFTTKKENYTTTALRGLAVFAMVSMVVSVLFKLQHYPGSGIMRIGTFFITACIGLLLFFQIIRNKDKIDYTNQLKIFIILLLAVIGQFIPFSHKVDRNRIFYKQLSECNKQMEEVVQSHLDSSCSKFEFINELEKLKHSMIKKSGGLDDNGYPIGFFDTSIPALIFLSQKGMLIKANANIKDDYFNGLNVGESLILITNLQTQLLLDCN